MKKINLIIPILFLFTSCDKIKTLSGKEEVVEDTPKPLARVKEIYLYPEDINGLIPRELDSLDSATRAEQIIKGWIKKQVVISEVQSRLDVDEDEMARKLLDYKYALMIHEFEKQYVNQELNKEVNSLEIEQYYNDNLDNFKLNQRIIKGLFIQIPKQAPNLRKFRRLLNSQRPQDREELRSYCYSYATKAHLGDSSWVYLEQMIVNTPLQDEANRQNFMRNNRLIEMSDEENNNLYFLKIVEYRLVNDISPLDFVWEEIEKIILNKRKVKLVNELENDIYERAERNRDFDYYSIQ